MKKIICMLLVMSFAVITFGCENKKDDIDKKKETKFDLDIGTDEIYDESESKKDIKKDDILNPFDDLKVSFLGASPFLRVNVDMSTCGTEEQNYVKISYDDKDYKIGDTVTVYATIDNSKGNNKYALRKESETYVVESVAEWITGVGEVDLSVLNKELDDKLVSETTETAGAWRFGGEELNSIIASIGTAELKASYFISLKPNLYNSFDSYSEYAVFNYYIQVYNFDIECDGTNGINHATVSCCVTMKNIKKQTDGTLTWNPKMEYSSSLNNYEQLINDEVISKREEYNVVELGD